MPNIFVIEDQTHAEWMGQFASLEEAWSELGRLSLIQWNEKPNTAPCQSWRTCGRDYEILEYETSALPWTLVRRLAGLEVSANGVAWGPDAPHHDA
jgi:hypothetical protein